MQHVDLCLRLTVYWCLLFRRTFIWNFGYLKWTSCWLLCLQVIDYLAKKGYSRTESMLRMESANQEIDGRPLPPLGEDARPKYRQGFGRHLRVFFGYYSVTETVVLFRLAQSMGGRQSWPIQGKAKFSRFSKVKIAYYVLAGAQTCSLASICLFLPEHGYLFLSARGQAVLWLQ